MRKPYCLQVETLQSAPRQPWSLWCYSCHQREALPLLGKRLWGTFSLWTWSWLFLPQASITAPQVREGRRYQAARRMMGTRVPVSFPHGSRRHGNLDRRAAGSQAARGLSLDLLLPWDVSVV